MKTKVIPFVRTLTRLGCSALVLFAAVASAAGSASAETVRVGVISYGDPEPEKLFQREPWLKQVVSQLGQLGKVQIAQGSYGEMVSWIESEKVDYAVITPGVAASLEVAGKGALLHYLASEADPQRAHSVCLIPVGSKISSLSDLNRLRELQYIFVDRLSVSGHILPQYLLRQAGIEVLPSQIRYAASHVNALRALESGAQPGERVACVWEQVFQSDPAYAAKFRPLNVDSLSQMEVPGNILIAVGDRTGENLSITPGGDLTVDLDWRKKVERTAIWLRAVDSAAAERSPARMNLEEIGLQLVNHLKTRETPPRLAVVLSGGGAKCSFQVGAIRAIEEHLEKLRAEYKEPKLDIGLVVGTSGGALNALAVALGASRSPAGYERFSKLWRELDQRQIIRPSGWVRLNMSLWFFSCQVLVLLAVARWIGGEGAIFGRQAPLIFGLLGLGQLSIVGLPISPASIFGDFGAGHRFFLWACWGMSGAGVFQLLLAAVVWLQRKRKEVPVPPPKLAFAGLLLLVIGLPAVQACTILWRQETLSKSDGIVELVAQNYPDLINLLVQEDGRTGFKYDGGGDPDDQVRALGAAVIKQKVIKRDLALTASRLPQTGIDLPSDLYFYLPASAESPKPRYHERGIALAQHPEQLFDVMIGSGAIYPVFPQRELMDFPSGGKSIEIVDGSFSHRSPIEAAVLWGATHIIVIEASPEEFAPRGAFAANVGAALAHLYDQAQLADIYSKQHVTTVTLFPKPPHIGLLDFSENFISQSIESGYSEARSDPGFGIQPFREEAGEPIFLSVE